MSLTRTSPGKQPLGSHHHPARLGACGWELGAEQRTEGPSPGKDDRRVSGEARVFIPAQGGQGSCGWQSGHLWWLSPLPGCKANTWGDLGALGSCPQPLPAHPRPQGTWQLQPLGHFAQIPPHRLGCPPAGLRGPHCPFLSSWLQLKGCRVRGWRWGWGSRSPGHAPGNKGRSAGWRALCQWAPPPSASTHLAASTSAADGETVCSSSLGSR